MTTKLLLLKFKVVNIKNGHTLSRHTKIKYARKSKTKFSGMGVPLTDMKVIYKPYDIIPHTYANVAKEFSKIFGYKMN